MNRRGFLSFLGAATVAPLVPVPDLLLPTRTIFLPPRGGWRPTIFTVQMIAKEALRILQTDLSHGLFVQRDYDRSFIEVSDDGGQTFAPLQTRTGVLNIRRPSRYDIRVGDRITIEGVRAK